MSQSDKPADELAMIDKEGALEIRIAPELDPLKTGGNVWTSLTPKTDLERITVMEAFQGSIPKLSTMMGQTVRVSNLGRQQVFITDTETNELFPAVRTVFFTVDGKLYSSVSRGIDQSIGQLIAHFKWPPWSPPLPLIPRELSRPGARRWYYLQVDQTALDKKGMLKA